jgi:YggT family protein
MANPIIWLILTVLDIYFWILVATVILSWLVAFNVINGHNPYVRQVRYALMRLTEPVLAPIRRMMPDLGGIDISPIIAAIGIQFIQYVVVYYGSQLL